MVVAAGPGLGRSVALRFAREGAAVGLVARSADSAAALAGELGAAGAPAVATAAADVGDEPALRAALGDLRARARAGHGTGLQRLRLRPGLRADARHRRTCAWPSTSA